jgi:hypothetical protein
MKRNLTLLIMTLLSMGLLSACNTQPTRPSLPQPTSPPAPSSSASQAQSQSAQTQPAPSQSSAAQSQGAQAQQESSQGRNQANQQQSTANEDEVLSRAMEDFQRQSAGAAQQQPPNQRAPADWSNGHGQSTSSAQNADSTPSANQGQRTTSPGTPQNWGSAPGEDGRRAKLPPPAGAGGYPAAAGSQQDQQQARAVGTGAASAAGQPVGDATSPAGTGSGQAQSVDQFGNTVIVIPGRAAKTDREQVATLDRRLNKEMVEFDGMILREREGVKERENESGASTGSGSGSAQGDAGGGFAGSERGTGYGTTGTGPGGGGEGDEPGGTFGTVARGAPPMPRAAPTGEDSGRGNRPLDGGDNRAGDYQHSAAVAPIPEDIPDGKDDDVVARQLREAAMREPDPELREKLWNEYRKYKREFRGR